MDSQRRPSEIRYVAARAFGLFAVFLAFHPLAVLVLLGVDQIWPHDGDATAHVVTAPVMAVLAVVFAALAWACDRGVLRLGSLPRPRGVALVLAIVGLVVALVSLYVVAASIWFDLTYFESGNIGASFAIVGIWFAYTLPLPIAAVILAVAAAVNAGPARFRRPAVA